MPEKPPDERDETGEQGDFERRDLLKGITLGAAGFAGAGAAVNGVMAQDQEGGPQETDTQPCGEGFGIDYVATVPEGQEATNTRNEFEDGPMSELDLVFSISFQASSDDPTTGVVDDTIPVGYYVSVVTDAPPEEREIVTRAFEEYEATAFAENVDVDAGGSVELRESISLNDLGGSPPNGYVAILTVMDLRGCCSAIECKPFQVSETGVGDAGAAGDQAAGNESAGDEAAGNETEATPTTTPAGNETG